MSTWAKVSKGDRVELKGKAFVVTKIKPKGKRAKVTVVGGGGRFESEVKLKDAVTIMPSSRTDKDGWYKPSKAERKASERERRNGLPAGDPTQTKPPAKAKGGPWETHADKLEAKLDKLIGAHLVAESTDEAQGYYVPPVDVTTVTSHMMLFHGGDAWAEHGEAELLKMHALQHEQARTTGAAFAVNHWHTKERPSR